MKAIQVELPDKLAAEIAVSVNAGWVGLLARFMRDDIEWALKIKGTPA